jgi:hypothetical protein
MWALFLHMKICGHLTASCCSTATSTIDSNPYRTRRWKYSGCLGAQKTLENLFDGMMSSRRTNARGRLCWFGDQMGC